MAPRLAATADWPVHAGTSIAGGRAEAADELAESEADDGSAVRDELDADATPGLVELDDVAGEIFGFGECFLRTVEPRVLSMCDHHVTV
eukprot:SAG22_NODE_219_length_14877_cov_14.334619_7_plen_89_part_00